MDNYSKRYWMRRNNNDIPERQGHRKRRNPDHLFESEFSRYDDGYDPNYPSPAYTMNSGDMNMGKDTSHDDGNMFKPHGQHFDDDWRYMEDEDELDDVYGQFDNGPFGRNSSYWMDVQDGFSSSGRGNAATARNGRKNNEMLNSYYDNPNQRNDRGYNSLNDSSYNNYERGLNEFERENRKRKYY